jgi:hypothetical protein
MPINAESINDVRAVSQLHGSLVDFGIFVQGVSDAVGTDYTDLVKLPARVTSLLNAKTAFDSLNISNARINAILESNLGYDDFSLHIADFAAIFTKAPAFRTLVENNIGMLPPSYDSNHRLVFVSAAAGVQTAITNNCNDILQHYEGL